MSPQALEMKGFYEYGKGKGEKSISFMGSSPNCVGYRFPKRVPLDIVDFRLELVDATQISVLTSQARVHFFRNSEGIRSGSVLAGPVRAVEIEPAGRMKIRGVMR